MNWLIEQSLYSAQQRFKWLLFGQRIGTAGSVLCVAWFLIQLAAWTGAFTGKWIYDTLVALMALVSLGMLVGILLSSLAHQEKRSKIAHALEKSCPPLMDRVNTLVYLEGTRPGRQLSRLKTRIEEQAAQLFETKITSVPYSPKPALLHLGVFFLLLGGVIFFQERSHPFKMLVAGSSLVKANSRAPFELPPQHDVTEARAKKVWGEVRIVDPGHDVKLTKIDVLPLQIEMTTSDAMEKPVWVSSVNGGDESPHELATPTDPNYMVYQPLIYLDQMKVTEWDVISYYAKVQSAAPGEYSSPLNFIEIRPFREDILKMTGGKGKNDRYRLLSELTGLIKQQTNLIQQTHQHLGMTYVTKDLRLQEASKLSQGENELATATNHFFGKIASESENTPVGAILDELSQAEQQMNRATQALQDDVAVEGKKQEQGALTHLIACRKAFQKTISDHPDAFPGDSSGDIVDDPTATAADSLKTLAQVSEMHDRGQSALQALRRITEQQQGLAQTQERDAPTALRQQMQVKSDLHDLMDGNPDLFRGVSPEAEAVQQNMMETIMKLSSGHLSEGKHSMAQTVDSLKDLERAVNKNHQTQQLAQAYQLKKIIDQNARELSQEKAKPGTLSDEETKNLADAAQRSTGTLKDIVDNDPGAGFGPELGHALSAGNQQALDNSLNQLRNFPGGPARGAAAGEAQNDLQGISRAFDKSQPDLTSQIRRQDQLQPGPGESLDQAVQQLQSMLLAAVSQHPNSPEDQAKASAQVLGDLQRGTDDPRFAGLVHDKLLADADKLLKQKVPGDAADPTALKKLLDEIEEVRIEANEASQPKPPELDTTQIDPSKFPPAYHDRLQNYFRQLSEQPRQ